MKFPKWMAEAKPNRVAQTILAIILIVIALLTLYATSSQKDDSIVQNNPDGAGCIGDGCTINQTINENVSFERYDATLKSLGVLEQEANHLRSENIAIANQLINENAFDKSVESYFIKGNSSEALSALRNKGELDSVHKSNIGDLEYINSNYSEAVSYYQAAAEMPNVSRLNKAKYLNKLGAAYHKLEQCDKAMPVLEESLKIRKIDLGDSHPTVAYSLDTLALCNKFFGKQEKAEKQWRRASEILRDAVGIEPYSFKGWSIDWTADRKPRRLKEDTSAIRQRTNGDYKKAVSYLDTLALIAFSAGNEAESEYVSDLAIHLNKLIGRAPNIYDAERYLTAADNKATQVVGQLKNYDLMVRNFLKIPISEPGVGAAMIAYLNADLFNRIESANSLYQDAIEVYENLLKSDSKTVIAAKLHHEVFFKFVKHYKTK